MSLQVRGHQENELQVTAFITKVRERVTSNITYYQAWGSELQVTALSTKLRESELQLIDTKNEPDV